MRPTQLAFLTRDQKSHAEAMEGVAAHRRQAEISRKGSVCHTRTLEAFPPRSQNRGPKYFLAQDIQEPITRLYSTLNHGGQDSPPRGGLIARGEVFWATELPPWLRPPFSWCRCCPGRGAAFSPTCACAVEEKAREVSGLRRDASRPSLVDERA